jgi:hypothetical protein
MNAARQPPAPVELRRDLATIERTLTDCIGHARVGTAARELVTESRGSAPQEI